MLHGRRLERIFSPRQGWWTFRLQSGPHPRHLLFAHHPAAVVLTLSARRPDNPHTPTVQVMRLRKQVQGLRILDTACDWVRRRFFLVLGHVGPMFWLTLDAKSGVNTQVEPPELDMQTVSWPSSQEIQANPEIWQTYPQVTPLLRATVHALPLDKGRHLLDTLQSLSIQYIHIYHDRAGRPIASPWLLPPGALGNLTLQAEVPPLSAANILADHHLFGANSAVPVEPEPRHEQRRRRLLRNLDKDARRMRAYQQLEKQAQSLRANLYHLPVHARMSRLTLRNVQGKDVELDLDSRMTVLENMEFWFRRAEKGRRGLAMIEQRRRALEADNSLTRPGPGPSLISGSDSPFSPRSTDGKQPLTPRKQKRAHQAQKRAHQAQKGAHQARSKANAPHSVLPVHRFLSSDGFVILRGKNQKANHALLTKASSSFDFWFHAAEGPGAHVILKRDSPDQDVPEQSLREAACLAGLASHFAGANRADVICAQVKHVRSVKGAPGLAKVDRMHCMLQVQLDLRLPERLQALP